MNINWTLVTQNAVTMLTQVGFKLVGAILLWFVGRFLIKIAVNLIGRAMDRQHLDTTIVTYARSTVNVTLTLALVVALLGFFGVETTTFAALLAGVGLAIGAAWSGLLANFASGIFLVILRPFRVGDFVTVAGVTGTVREIGLFSTAVDTPDNVHTSVGNGKIFSETIQNFSANPYRRVDISVQLAHSTDPQKAMDPLRDGLARIPNITPKPVPDLAILKFTYSGPVLVVRPYCANADYWQVYFDTTRMIHEEFAKAGFEPPDEFVEPGRAAGA